MRLRLVAGRPATLKFIPNGAAALGTITSATVTIRQSIGLDLPTPVTDQVTVVTDGELSFALPGAQLQEPRVAGGYLYRAAWAYVIDGVTYEADQLFEVRKRILLQTLTEEEVVRHLPARLDELQESGSITDEVADAWSDVLDDVAARGFDPDRIMDADRLRRPHRVKVLATLGANWGPAWREWADKKATEYSSAIDAALNAGDWYDQNSDALEAKGETKVTSVVLTR